jgi:hypothetical protein
MSKAPERIWAWPSERGWYAAECSYEVNLGLLTPECDLQTDYIRADIHEDRVKELEDVVKNLWRRQDSLDTFDAAVNAVLAPLFEKQLKENNTNE